ncbi:MAG: AMP-binding protein [Acidobacteria bacterium]|nr:AMP-binding protein [Acidobacteriota bacterium]
MKLDFFEQFQSCVDRLPDHVGLIQLSESGRESFTYRRIAEEISAAALFLKAQGVRPGHAVGILMENHPRWGISFLAVQGAGAVVVPFDVLHTTATLKDLIQHAGCTFLISSEKFLPRLREIQGLLPRSLPALVSGAAGHEYFSWDDIQPSIATSALPLHRRAPDDPLLILYTSGTTGDPKGVVLTEKNVYSNVIELLSVIQVSSQDHVLSVLPLYHVLALMTNFIIPLYVGARVSYLDVLDAPRILQAFREEGVTIFVCVPQFYYLMQRRILQQVSLAPWLRRYLFSRLLPLSHFLNERMHWNPGKLFFGAFHQRLGPSLRLFGVGGARFDPEVAFFFRDLGFNIVQAYGMTETAAIATVTPPNGGVGSVGRPLPHVEVRIDRPEDHGIGEVLIRGHNVMKEYWRNPQATAETLQGEWLHTGDLGYLSTDGFLHITGRSKDVIVLSSGKNIYPEDVEHYYQSKCSLIKEICVMGLPEDVSEKEEKLHAIIVPDFEALKERQVVNAYGAIRYELENLSQQIPPHKRVRSFEIRKEPFPRTTTRKIKRFVLRQEVLEQRQQVGSPAAVTESRPENAVEEKVFALIRQMKKRPLSRDMNLELDLGIDSLERVELLSSIEEAFQIAATDAEAASILTVKDLVALVQQKLSGDLVAQAKGQLSWDSILREPLQEEEQKELYRVLRRRPFVEVLMYLIARTIYWSARVLFRLKFAGVHNLPRQFPFMICANHLSFLDVFLLVSKLPFRVIRRVCFLGYSAYFTGPAMSFLGSLVKVIPVDPDQHLKQALRLAAEGLRRELVLCVFPEGERSIDGTLKEFRKGPAILAAEFQVPVIPAGIKGTFEAWPRASPRIQLHPISIKIGEALQPPFSESYESLNQRLFAAVKKQTETDR